MNQPEIHESESRPLVTSRGILVFLGLLVLYAFFKHAVFDVWVQGYEGGDFTIYYVAAERIASGESPYPIEAIRSYRGEGASPIWGEYPYPPLLARLLVPLTRFPVFTAKWIYTGILLTIFFGLTGLLYRLYRPHLRPGDSFLLWAVLLGWGPFIYSIRLGQCELLAMPFLVLAWIFLVRGERNLARKAGWDVLAGMAMGVAAMVRLTPILMIPVFVVTFRWRLVVSFVFGSVLALVLSGPQASWQFLTEVLPTMSDVSEMRHCPAFHVLLLRGMDTLTGWLGIETDRELDRWVSLIGTGMFFMAILVWIHNRRFRFGTVELFLIACYLPPLLAGKNPHHYSLALLPALAGSVISVRSAWPRGTGRDRVRLLLGILFLLPTFNYWRPVNSWVDWLATVGPVSRNPLFILGHVGVLFLLLSLLSRNSGILEERVSPK